MRKRILSILLVVVMCFTMMPMSVSADDAAAVEVASVTTGDSTDTYTDIHAAVDAAEAAGNSTLKLLADVVLDNGLSIAIEGGTFTFDLAGHTITFEETTANVAVAVSGGNVTFMDSDGEGNVTVPGTYTGSYALKITGGTVTIQSGSFNSTYAVKVESSAELHVNGGTLCGTFGYGIYNNKGTVIITDGLVQNLMPTEGRNMGFLTAVRTTGSFIANGGTFEAAYTFAFSDGIIDLQKYPDPNGFTFLNPSATTTDVSGCVIPEGYVFVDKDGNQVTTASGEKEAKVLTLRSKDSLLDCTVSFHANGGSGSMESTTVLSGFAYTLPECGFTAPEGKYFSAWEVNGIQYPAGETVSITADTEIKAVWADITYTVTYEAGEGSGSMDAASATALTPFTLPECGFTAPSGYEFKAWSIDGIEYAPNDSYTFTADTTVTALWQIAATGPAMVLDNDGTVLGRYATMKDAITAAGEHEGSTLKLMESVHCSETISTGVFTVDINGQTVTSDSTVFTVHAPAEITFTDTAGTKGLVKSTSTSVLTAAVNASGGTVIIDDGIYVGSFSVRVGNAGNLSIRGGSVYKVLIYRSGMLDFTEHENPVGILLSYASETSGGTIAVSEIIKLPAEYAVVGSDGYTLDQITDGFLYTIGKVYSITFDPNGGSGSMDSAFTEGSYTLPSCAFTREGYTFRAWAIGETEYLPGESCTITEDTTIQALWEIDTYTVTFDAGEGTGDMDAVKIEYGKVYTLPDCGFTAPANKEFDGWQIGDVTYQAGDSISVTGDVTAAALWKDILYTVTFDANGGSGTMDPQTGVSGSNFLLPACTFTAPEGKMFQAWQVDGDEYQQGYDYPLTGNLTVYAVWVDIPADAAVMVTSNYLATRFFTNLKDAYEYMGSYMTGNVILLRDIKQSETIIIPEYCVTALVLNGFDISCTADPLFTIPAQGVLRIEDTSEIPGTISGSNYIFNVQGGALTIAGGNFIAENAAVVRCNGENAQVAIAGGTFEGWSAVFMEGGYMEIQDGDLSKTETQIFYQSGTLDLSKHPDPSGWAIEYLDITPIQAPITLPEGYSILNGESDVGTTLYNGISHIQKKYNIKTVIDEEFGKVEVIPYNGTPTDTALAGVRMLISVTYDYDDIDDIEDFQGYLAETITVTDSDGNPVENRNGVFIMPASDITVTVTSCQEPPLVDDVFEISNTTQLIWFAELVNNVAPEACGKLMNDIDMTNRTPLPIGTENDPYTGTFDGQGYSIRNMVIDSTEEYQGLFGVVGVGAVIKNIVIDASCSVSGGNYTAALVGGSVRYASGEVIIENCVNYANVSGGQHTGGIFGCNTGDDATIIIRNCANLGNITGGKNCGTIAGYLGSNTVGTLESCWNTGTLTATSGDSFAHFDKANIINCYNLDTLTASTKEGVATFAAEELKNGALAYKLGGNWGQTIGTDEKPVLGGAKVYYGYTDCQDTTAEYSNTELKATQGHTYDNGVCTVCGGFLPAVENNGVYEISNKWHLLWFASEVNSGNTTISGKLMNSIDLSGVTYTPIGTTTYPYTGTFDGQGYSIQNMTISDTTEYQGLFGVVGAGATIKNIIIDASCSISGGDFTAALVGGSVRDTSGNVTIENCINYANVSGGKHTGGIFGCNTGDDATIIIRNCANLGNITGGENCGTIAGYLGTNTVGTLENCWNTGTLTATSGDSFAHLDAANITNCWNLNTLTASTKDGVSTFTEEELANGALAYKLGTPWGQTIGSNSTPILGGGKVYQFADCQGNTAYSNTEDIPAAGHSYVDGVCTVCGEAEPDAVVQPTLSLNYGTVSFESEIQYNIYYNASDLDDVVEMGLVTFDSQLTDGTIDDAVNVFSGYVTDGTLYMVKTGGIAAKNMGDQMWFKIYAKLTDGSYVYSAMNYYSAVRYATSILNQTSNSSYMKALVVAMLNYGAEAQLYFGHNTDALANTSLTDAQKALNVSYDESLVADLVTVDSAKSANFPFTASAFTNLYPSVSFDGAFSINFYFTSSSIPDDGMTFYYWDLETYDSVTALTKDNATGTMDMTLAGTNMYYGAIKDIAAKEIDETVFVVGVHTVDGVEYTTGIIPYSLGRYCETMAAKDTSDQQAFAQATAVYGFYAKEYFANL